MSKITPDHHCCGIEKKELMKDVRECKANPPGSAQRHACLRDASRASKRRTQACFYS